MKLLMAFLILVLSGCAGTSPQSMTFNGLTIDVGYKKDTGNGYYLVLEKENESWKLIDYSKSRIKRHNSRQDLLFVDDQLKYAQPVFEKIGAFDGNTFECAASRDDRSSYTPCTSNFMGANLGVSFGKNFMSAEKTHKQGSSIYKEIDRKEIAIAIVQSGVLDILKKDKAQIKKNNGLPDYRGMDFDTLEICALSDSMKDTENQPNIAKLYISSDIEMQNEHDAYVKAYGDDAGYVRSVQNDLLEKVKYFNMKNNIYIVNSRFELNMDMYDYKKERFLFNNIHFNYKTNKKYKTKYYKYHNMLGVDPTVGFINAQLKLNLSEFFIPVSKDQLYENLKTYGSDSKIVVNTKTTYKINECRFVEHGSRKIYQATHEIICDADILDSFYYLKESLVNGEISSLSIPDGKLTRENDY